MSLTERQQREIDYHRERAQTEGAKRVAMPLSFDVLDSAERRWWNPYWATYDTLLRFDLRDKTALVVGCGFGEDAIRLARLAKRVHAFDISPESVEIARRRALEHGCDNVVFDTAPAERTPYPDAHFDFLLFVGILHHVDIPTALAEARRVAKPDASFVASEVYTHGALKRIRQSALVTRGLYPAMKRWIYGKDEPYITADERTLTEQDLALVRAQAEIVDEQYYDLFAGRVVPKRFAWAEKLDRAVLRQSLPLARLLGSWVILTGKLNSGPKV